MTITMNRVCAGVTSAASSVGKAVSAVGGWAGRTVSAAGGALASAARSVTAVAQPYFKAVQNFLAPHQGKILTGAVVFAAGAATYAVASRFFCAKSTPATTPVAAAPAAAKTPAAATPPTA